MLFPLTNLLCLLCNGRGGDKVVTRIVTAKRISNLRWVILDWISPQHS